MIRTYSTSHRVAVVLAGLLAGASGVAGQSPTPLTPWIRGTLGLHHLATGQGCSPRARAAFFLRYGPFSWLNRRAANAVFRDTLRPRVDIVPARSRTLRPPGSESYQTFVLDNRTESRDLLSTHGPYPSGR